MITQIRNGPSILSQLGEQYMDTKADTQVQDEHMSVLFTALPAAGGYYCLGLKLTFPFLWCTLLPKIEAKEDQISPLFPKGE